jgi:hypothetical protein
MSVFQSPDAQRMRLKLTNIRLNIEGQHMLRGRNQTEDEAYRLDEIMRLADSIRRDAQDMKQRLLAPPMARQHPTTAEHAS